MMNQNNEPLNEKYNLDKSKSNGQQMKIHRPWNQVWKNSQRSTETVRRIPKTG